MLMQEMLTLFYGDERGDDKIKVSPKIVINNLWKPNLYLAADDLVTDRGEFKEWKECIARMASFDSTFMNLSGAFSEVHTTSELERP
jgi:hypothetical protein